MNFSSRPPSVAWDPVAVPELANCSVWVWFKPAAAPLDVVFQVPDDTYRLFAQGLTVRRFMAAVEIDPSEADSWTVARITYPVQSPANPLLDQPIPPPGPAGVTIHMKGHAAIATPLPAAATTVSQPSPAASAGGLAMLEAMDAEWQSIIQLERQLEALRRQLGGIQGSLQSLNRDLDADERLFSDNQDRKEWGDARRWLRDGLAQVSKAIRAYDIGVTSAAGNRRRFEEIHKQSIEPRTPFPGMEVEQYAFEQHRKNNQNLILQMQAAHTFAARDGVQRAQMVLARIAGKVRRGRAKR